MSESMSLARYDKMCLAILEAREVDEVKEIRNQAKAFQEYARQAKNKEAERHCAEIRIRAERRAGELLDEMADARTGPKVRCPDGTELLVGTPTLEELGVSKKQSSKWQALAGIPVEEFEEVLASGGDIPTTEGVLRRAVAGEQRGGHRRIYAAVEDLIDGQPTIAGPGEIWQADFLEWAPTYEGPKFNFLHCDFPYGIDSDKSGLHPSGYEDSPNVLKKLSDCLETNFDRLCSRPVM